MWTYVIIGVVGVCVVGLCFALAVASFSSENFFSKWKEVNETRNSIGITTFNYVSDINKRYFEGRLKLTRCPDFEDHYSTGIVALSDKTMQSNSLASLAIVSHELGHARQDFSGDKLKKHWRLRKAGRICGLFFMPLFIAGTVLTLLWFFNLLPELFYLILGMSLFAGSLVIFVFAIVLKWKEIKIEREASDFALEFLREYLTEKEVKIAQELLNAARLTYWATLIRTLLSWTLLTSKAQMFN